jgi:hypothetical protein
LAVVPVVLASVAALLLLGGVLFAMATAAANGVDATARFRLLGQAANPFVAFLVLVACALVVDARRREEPRWTAPGVALGIATAVALAAALLALNGVLTDVTGHSTALFRFSAVVSRVGTLAMSGLTLWLSAAAGPRR